VPPECFTPQPHVWSGTVLLEPRSRWFDERLAPAFFETVRNCFRQKRKTLLNNLTTAYGKETAQSVLDTLRIPSHVRAEQTSLEQFHRIFCAL
jgi:16S rRNA (adenine1518-N6/adenine1519-N6)-dimethyltransferase